jgi:hypothetical protein
MLNCLQIHTGLIRKRAICIYGVDLARRGSEIITLGLGTVALITRDGALIASEHSITLKREITITPSQGDTLVKAKVHREYCWDRLFLWPPNEAVEMVDHLVNSGLHVEYVLSPNHVIHHGLLVKLQQVWSLPQPHYHQAKVPISTLPVQVSILEIKELGRGKLFWSYGGCIAGRYINDALSALGFRVV